MQERDLGLTQVRYFEIAVSKHSSDETASTLKVVHSMLLICQVLQLGSFVARRRALQFSRPIDRV